MNIEDMKKMTKDMLTPNEVAAVLNCDPNAIRYQAKTDIKQLGFPATKVKSRVKIPRLAFIRWFENK